MVEPGRGRSALESPFYRGSCRCVTGKSVVDGGRAARPLFWFGDGDWAVVRSARKLLVKAILSIGFAVCNMVSVDLLQPMLAHAQENPIAKAVSYCRNSSGSIRLSDDKAILCFDGAIHPNRDITAIRDLRDDGMFVIRSGGGNVKTAMEIADVLQEKNALVIIYDYCLSACAGFIFIASAETFVTKNTVVAWHAPCASGPIREYSFAEKEKRCRAMIPANEFVSKRAIGKNRRVEQFVYSPQSSYTKKMVLIAYDGSLFNRDVFWMWNPRYYRLYLKAKITYESYPESQSEVDEITSKFHLPNIIYDP